MFVAAIVLAAGLWLQPAYINGSPLPELRGEARAVRVIAMALAAAYE